MQRENTMTVGRWCGQWFIANRPKWNGNTEGGYRNLIYSHIIPNIESVALPDLTEQAVTDFYDALRSQGLSARSIWCVHLLLRRCMDEAAQEQLIPYNPVRLCQEPKVAEYKAAPLRLGQILRYLNTASIALFRTCGFHESTRLKDWIRLPQGYADALIFQKFNRE